MRHNPWVRAIDVLIESCWLLALVAVPIYFDTLTTRIFEPDKIVLFRNIVIVMVLAVLVRAVLVAPAVFARRSAGRQATAAVANGNGHADGDLQHLSKVTVGGAPRHEPWWRGELLRRPMLLPVIVFVAIYSIATIHSVLPWISFWGSYDRMQGFYTYMNYVTLCAIMAYSIRSWAQIERVISAFVFTSVPVSFYGIMQHYQWDPVQWGADTSTRVASTLGNAIFLGAYVIMCMPFIMYRLWGAIQRLRTAPTQAATRRPLPKDTIEINGFHPVVPVIGYAIILLLNFAALYWCGSRGPYYGFVAGLFVAGFPLTLKFKNPYPAMASIVLAIAIFAFPQVLSKVTTAINPSSSTAADATHLTSFDVSGTAEVRQYIWQGSVGLIKASPILGWGPEDMIYVYSPYYPSGLGHIERSNAAPDRNHDVWLDYLVFAGVLGLLAWLGVLAGFALTVIRVLQRAQSQQVTLLGAALLAIVVSHLVEASVGIPIVSTLMLLWTTFALATVLCARRDLLPESEARAVAAAGSLAAGQLREPALSGTGGVRSGRPATAGAARTTRSGGGASARAASAGRGGRPVAAPVPTPSFATLNGGQQGLLLGLIVVVLAAIGGGGALFWNNVQVVRADAFYKLGQGYDSYGVQCLNHAANPGDPGAAQQCPTPSQYTARQIADFAGQQVLPAALNYYQQAVDAQPNQDMYDLWLGKTYLDEARYYQAIGQSNDVISSFQNAEATLLRAKGLNPYNADHPMNLARMYSGGWARIDVSKWAFADRYYKIATGLARHNGRWSDEWGAADLTEAAQVTGLTAARRTVLYQQALAAFQHSCTVDDLLGDARIYRGQAYQLLGDNAAAAASYQEALKVGNFEPQTTGFSTATAVQDWVNALYAAHNYTALVKPVAIGTYGTQSPITLAYSSTLIPQYTNGFTQTLQIVSATLRQKGLLK